MKLFNEKPISQIKAEKEMLAAEPLLDLYEAVVGLGEELENANAEIAALKKNK